MKVYIVNYAFTNDRNPFFEFVDKRHSIIAINEEEAWLKFLDWCKLNSFKFPLCGKFDIREVTGLPEPTYEPQTV
jgi:hypothetical protein